MLVQSKAADTNNSPNSSPLSLTLDAAVTGKRIVAFCFDSTGAANQRTVTCAGGLTFSLLTDGTTPAECDNTNAHLKVFEHIVAQGENAPGAITFSVKDSTGTTEQSANKSLIVIELDVVGADKVAVGAQRFTQTTFPTGATAALGASGEFAIAAVSMNGPRAAGTWSDSYTSPTLITAERAQLTVNTSVGPASTSSTLTVSPAVSGRGLVIVWKRALALTGVGRPHPTGTPTVGLVQNVAALTGIAATSAVGIPTFASPTSISLTGIAATSAVGSIVTYIGVQSFLLAEDGSLLLAEDGTILLGEGDQAATPEGVAPTSALGTLTFSTGGVTFAIVGIGPTSEVGAPGLMVVGGGTSVPLTGVPSSRAMGTPTLFAGTLTQALTGVASTSALGTPDVEVQTAIEQSVFLFGIASHSVVFRVQIGNLVVIDGVASTSAVGVPVLPVTWTLAGIFVGATPGVVSFFGVWNRRGQSPFPPIRTRKRRLTHTAPVPPLVFVRE